MPIDRPRKPRHQRAMRLTAARFAIYYRRPF